VKSMCPAVSQDSFVYEYDGSCLIWLIIIFLWVYCEPVISGLGVVVEVEVWFLDGGHVILIRV